jgi:AcrR family transcriptional regulator
MKTTPPKTTPSKTPPPYHHGNARTALIAAARELLEITGATQLSLRAVAEKAGLSRQAPYNHFPSKEALLAAIAAEGFRELSEAMDAGMAQASDDIGRLTALGVAYIAFAQANPSLFRLMFQSELVDLSRFPEAEAAGEATHARCLAGIAAIAPEASREGLSILAWSVVHGYATLSIELAFDPPENVRERAAFIAELLVLGGAEMGAVGHSAS